MIMKLVCSLSCAGEQRSNCIMTIMHRVTPIWCTVNSGQIRFQACSFSRICWREQFLGGISYSFKVSRRLGSLILLRWILLPINPADSITEHCSAALSYSGHDTLSGEKITTPVGTRYTNNRSWTACHYVS